MDCQQKIVKQKPQDIKEESEKSKKGLGNCLSGQYWVIKKRKRDEKRTGRSPQGAMPGNNERKCDEVCKKKEREEKKGLGDCLKGQYWVTMKDYTMNFAERSLTVLLGQENEHGFRKWLWEQRSRRNQLKNEQV